MSTRPASPKEQETVPEPDRLPTRTLVAVIGTMAAGSFLMLLNETVLSVALPSIMADLGVSAIAGQWLTTSYLLMMAVIVPMTGFLQQRFAPRTLFLSAVSVFIVGTLLAVSAVNFPMLLLARVVQAGGTGVVMPLLMATTLSLVPVGRRGTVMGLNSIVIAMAPAIGPTASGMIVESASWRYIFALTLPVAIIVLGLGLRFIRIPAQTRKTAVDPASVVLSAVAFGSLVYAISAAGSGNAEPIAVLIFGTVGAAGLALFAHRQVRLARTGRELLNLSPFANRTFLFSAVLLVTTMGTLLGTVVMLPIVLENGAGHSSREIGLMLLPGGLVQVVLSPLFGRVYDRFGPGPVLIPGISLLALSQWLYSATDAGTPLLVFTICNLLLGCGLSLMITGLLSTALSSVPRQLYGHGSALFNTTQQLGGAVGTAVFVAILSAVGSGAESTGPVLFEGARTAFTVGGTAASIGIVLAVLVTVSAKRSAAAEAIQKPREADSA